MTVPSRGDARLIYTDHFGSTVHVNLNWPIELAPRADISVGVDKYRRSVTSLDGTNTETARVGSGQSVIVGRIRYEGSVTKVERLLEHATDGVSLTYEVDGRSIPCEMHFGGERGMEMVTGDPDDWHARRVQVAAVRLKRTDGGTWATLLNDTLFEYGPGHHLQTPTFSRSTEATYFDENGVRQTASSGVLRDEHYVENENGVLVRATRLEASRTNELHNSESPATQTRNLTAGTYTLWMEGSGSVDASGATDGSYGTATESTTNENDLTFTVSAQQDVTFTVNNSVDRFQCEEGAFRSSFIATQGSAVSRAVDTLEYPFSTVQTMTRYVKFVDRGYALDGIGFGRLPVSVGEGASNSWRLRSRDGGFRSQFADADGTVTNAGFGNPSTSFGDVVEIRTVLDTSVPEHFIAASVNGGSETVSNPASIANLPTRWNQDKIVMQDANVFVDIISGPIIAPGVRTMDEMRAKADKVL